MYKPLADSTLMSMTKKEIIEQLRTAEHNFKAMEETVNQQAENFIKLLAEEHKHGHWVQVSDWDKNGQAHFDCSVCGAGDVHADDAEVPYCWHCGAVMDEVVKNENSM